MVPLLDDAKMQLVPKYICFFHRDFFNLWPLLKELCKRAQLQCSKHVTSKFPLLRMSDMRMEELNRRHSVILGSQSPLKSPQGSLMSHNNRSSDKSDEYSRSPAPDTTAGTSRQNSLVVAVQQRRASIISIGQQGGHHSQDNLLEVTAGGQHMRSGSIRSSHSNHLAPAQVKHSRSNTVKHW